MSDKKSEKGYGCAPLGCAIILLAVSAVIFYFIVKPALNERGITWASVKDKVAGSSGMADNKVAESKELLNNTKEKLQDIGRDSEEHLPKIPVQLYQE